MCICSVRAACWSIESVVHNTVAAHCFRTLSSACPPDSSSSDSLSSSSPRQSVKQSRKRQQHLQHSDQQQQPQRQQQRQQRQQQQQQEREQEHLQTLQHCGDQSCSLTVAVIGLPNAGKSTLTNRLIGTKISAVSSKQNTTINPQLGSFTVGRSQVALYDTPGLVHQPGLGNPVERLRSAWSTAASADCLLLIVDAERQFRLQEPAMLMLVQQLASGPPNTMARGWQRPPTALFMNKQDKLSPEVRTTVLQQLQQQLSGLLPFDRVFAGAAMLGQGVDALRSYLVKQARPGRWLLPAGQSHAASPGDLAVELVREKLYRRLNQEVPYRLVVELTGVWQAAPPASLLTINISVGVPNKVVKSMVIGKQGQIIQGYVTEPTQAELTRILRQPVRLVVSVQLQDKQQ